MNTYSLKKIVKDYSKKELSFYSEENSLFLAFLSCFSAKEIINNINWEEGNQQILKSFKNKIRYDLKNNIETKVYSEYFLNLLKDIEKMSFHKKRKIISFTSQCSDFLSKNILETFICYCINSKNKTFRNSAWKKISTKTFTKKQILNLYNNYKDEKALPLIYSALDKNSFLKFFNTNFENVRTSEYFFRKICSDLFLQIPNKIKEKIKNFEPETYLYLHVINKISISEKEAFSIYKKSSNKSLAIWSIGKMKLINTLIKIKNETSKN